MECQGLSKVGFHCKRVGTLTRGESYDLTRASVLRKIRQDIAGHFVLAAMLVPACSSFSVSRDRTSYPNKSLSMWGVPLSQQSEKDRDCIATGNKCFRAAI